MIHPLIDRFPTYLAGSPMIIFLVIYRNTREISFLHLLVRDIQKLTCFRAGPKHVELVYLYPSTIMCVNENY
jgi:hypothetical protein